MQRPPVTKAEYVALRHVVIKYDALLSQMYGTNILKSLEQDIELEQLAIAKLALRRFNQLRQQARRKRTIPAHNACKPAMQKRDQVKQPNSLVGVLTESGHKQLPITLNMLRSLHHLLAGRKHPKYSAFYMGYWGLRQRGMVTDQMEVTELGRQVAGENAEVMARFTADEKDVRE